MLICPAYQKLIFPHTKRLFVSDHKLICPTDQKRILSRTRMWFLSDQKLICLSTEADLSSVPETDFPTYQKAICLRPQADLSHRPEADLSQITSWLDPLTASSSSLPSAIVINSTASLSGITFVGLLQTGNRAGVLATPTSIGFVSMYFTWLKQPHRITKFDKNTAKLNNCTTTTDL